MLGSTFCTRPRYTLPISELCSAVVDVVLDEHVVLGDRDLGQVLAGPDHHRPLDRLAAGQELGLGHDRRAAATGGAALAAALLLRLQPGRALDRGDLVRDGLGTARLTDPYDGLVRVVRRRTAVLALAAATTATAARRAARAVVLGIALLVGVVRVGLALGVVLGLVVVLVGAVLGTLAGLAATTATAAAATATGALGTVLAVGVVRLGVCVGGLVGRRVVGVDPAGLFQNRLGAVARDLLGVPATTAPPTTAGPTGRLLVLGRVGFGRPLVVYGVGLRSAAGARPPAGRLGRSCLADSGAAASARGCGRAATVRRPLGAGASSSVPAGVASTGLVAAA